MDEDKDLNLAASEEKLYEELSESLVKDHEEAARELEKDLEDFFAMRASERANISPADAALGAGSGCCMTGCPGCPWGYELPKI